MVSPSPKRCCSQWRAASSITRSKSFGFPIQGLHGSGFLAGSGQLFPLVLGSLEEKIKGGKKKKKQYNPTKNQPNSMGALVCIRLKGER